MPLIYPTIKHLMDDCYIGYCFKRKNRINEEGIRPPSFAHSFSKYHSTRRLTLWSRKLKILIRKYLLVRANQIGFKVNLMHWPLIPGNFQT